MNLLLELQNLRSTPYLCIRVIVLCVFMFMRIDGSASVEVALRAMLSTNIVVCPCGACLFMPRVITHLDIVVESAGTVNQ